MRISDWSSDVCSSDLDTDALRNFLWTYASVSGLKILVHGGGKIASTIGLKLGIEPRMAGGRRITDADTLDVVTMVYAGLVNKNVVAGLQDRQSTRLNSSHSCAHRMPSSA